MFRAVNEANPDWRVYGPTREQVMVTLRERTMAGERRRQHRERERL
jgi:hypothetical protein